ncbi:hypothetical protein FQ142_07195 [Microbacterium sp. ANT_H45B]|uniref:hypothetical protein n=1 Tax=Microbacterium sp. ANT_H45B TaxID=2597346 RepID=UPI0011EEFC69|nr:hypothetical protein [Microbacterium sp. ANT_H45B]KAA0960674.1 hypothetical protein FQ142_07195 [Microbacterium sp. ANT_H45B]
MTTATLDATQIRFLTRLQHKLRRQNRELREGHVRLALSAQESSSLTHAVTAPVFGFPVVVALAALAFPVTAPVTPNQLVIATVVLAIGVAFYGVIWGLGPHLQRTQAVAEITRAELDDQRVIAGLRGRARRDAEASLASFSAPWTPARVGRTN